jgi:hypothetical protein
VSRYRWDLDKEAVNIAKHGVAFLEAESAVDHVLAQIEPDLSDADGGRFRNLGWSSAGRLLMVITSEHEVPPRIISARRATKRERHAYERGR